MSKNNSPRVRNELLKLDPEAKLKKKKTRKKSKSKSPKNQKVEKVVHWHDRDVP